MIRTVIHSTWNILAKILLFAGIGALLSLVLVVHPELPADETIGQWVWFDKAAIIASVCTLLSILLGKRALELTTTVMWALIVLGGIEAIWGLRQLYGFFLQPRTLFGVFSHDTSTLFLSISFFAK